MNSRLIPLLACFALVLMVREETGAQVQLPGARVLRGTSLDMSIDPRNSALGEATVGLPGGCDPFESNPAGLAGQKGAWVKYAGRILDPSSDDIQMRAWSGGALTPFGVFAATYRRNDLGEIPVTTEQAPDGVAAVKSYDYTAGLAWAYAFGGGIQVGAAVKMFKEERMTIGTLTWSEYLGRLAPTTNRPLLLDLGVLCSTGPLFAGGRAVDNFSFGAAAQNFGTPYRARVVSAYPLYGAGVKGTPYTYDYVQQLPRLFRIGAAYQLRLGRGNAGDLDPLTISVTGEFRSILNAMQGDQGSYWGVGFEATILEVLSLRLGGMERANTSGPGSEYMDDRYGLGLRFPAKLGGADALPVLVLRGSYTWMPGKKEDWFPDPDNAHIFDLGVQYIW